MGSDILEGRLAKELLTIKHMLQIYCKAHCRIEPKVDGLCPDCLALLNYAEQKLDRCPYGEAKPDCARCPIHCYKPEPRTKAREVMIYSGPRMLTRHPLKAIQHLLDKRRPIPDKPPAGASQYARRKAQSKNKG